MNWDRVEGAWKQVRGKVKEQWGQITCNNLDVITGQREQRLGRMQESYGIAKDEARRLLEDWEQRNQRYLHLQKTANRH